MLGFGLDSELRSTRQLYERGQLERPEECTVQLLDVLSCAMVQPVCRVSLGQCLGLWVEGQGGGMGVTASSRGGLHELWRLRCAMVKPVCGVSVRVWVSGYLH